MTKKFAAPRGTADILPEESEHWYTVEASAKSCLASHGYREIRTPIYEETALFKRSLGQTSDIINKQLLELKTDKEEGYALRPEGTASIVRCYLENSFDKKEPISKFYYAGPMFRGERPQKGRLRQFHQIGVEVIGTNCKSPYLDAEIIILAMRTLERVDVEGLSLRINSLGSHDDKAHISSWLREQLSKQNQEFCQECQDRLDRNVFRVLDCKKEGCQKLIKSIVKQLPLSKESEEYFQIVQKALRSSGVVFTIAPQLVRGLDYYIHTVFEITAQGLGSQDAVGAGGRYDGLVHELGGDPKVDYGAIGFALGVERILLSRSGQQDGIAGIYAFVIPMTADIQELAFKVTDQLRKGYLAADMSYGTGSMKSQLSRANKLNAKFVLILGEEEIKSNTITVKDMKTGAQERAPLNEIVGFMRLKQGSN